jgi:hypothetical protein
MGLLDLLPRRRPHDTGFATGSTTTNSSVTATADYRGGDAGTGTGAPPAMTAAAGFEDGGDGTGGGGPGGGD